MTAPPETPTALIHDRQLLLCGPMREKLLTLEEIEQYGKDSFADWVRRVTRPTGNSR
jgi:hypothetical protein